MDKRSNSPSVIRTVIIAVLVIVLIYLFFSFFGPMINAQLSIINNPSTKINYEIIGTSKSAVITYTKVDGNISEPTGVDVPWHSKVMTVRSGTLVILTGAATDGGTIKCIIMNGNELVDMNTSNPFNDKAMCGGYVK